MRERVPSARHERGRREAGGLCFSLVAGNLAAWCWALAAFHGSSVLLATAGLAYGFGLRHGFDADHVAAIDNVVRKLMHDGRRPLSAGLFFALGHSTLVVVVSTLIALSAGRVSKHVPGLIQFGGTLGNVISALLLLVIGVMNLAVFGSVWRMLRRARHGEAHDEETLGQLLVRRGFLARVFRHVFALVNRNWHMYFVGVLFAFGFDTATEIGILAISASQAVNGLSAVSILVFPVLFAAGMTLIDGCDGVLMLEAYGWVFRNPLRKLYYNLAITGISIVLAVVVGGFEALGVIAEHFSLPSLAAMTAAAGETSMLGYFAFGAVAAIWLGRFLMRRIVGS